MALIFLASCSREADLPFHLSARDSDIIALVRRTLEQQEDWVAKAEFKIAKRSGGYEVTAWKVVHPEAKGNLHHLPLRYSTTRPLSSMSIVERPQGM